MSKPDITVTVSGPVGSGTTRVAKLIADALWSEGAVLHTFGDSLEPRIRCTAGDDTLTDVEVEVRCVKRRR